VASVAFGALSDIEKMEVIYTENSGQYV